MKDHPSTIEKLKPDYFFHLDKYHHKELFQNIEYVWMALTRIEPYLKAFKKKEIRVRVPEGAFLVDSETIDIGEGTIVEPGAYIKGPCIIGKNCVVRHGAYIRGNFIAGDDCVIGHDTEVKNTIFLDETRAGHFAYLGDTILGNKVNLGAGTKCANLKLNEGQIVIQCDGKRFATELRKMGAIIGDETQTGCNSVMNPGALLGKKVYCYPCVNVSGFIPSHHIVKPEKSALVIPKKGH